MPQIPKTSRLRIFYNKAGTSKRIHAKKGTNMKICTQAETISFQNNYYSIQTNSIEIRLWFVTDNIIRIRAGFDQTWDEASYSLVTAAWDSRTDQLFDQERKKIPTACSTMTDRDDHAVIEGKQLKVVIHKNPFTIEVLDHDGQLIHKDIPDLAYRMDANGRRHHTSQIEADDCFYGFGEKSGTINKAEKFMNMAPGDAMGYNPKETDSLYKHIPFYIRLNKNSHQAVGYFYHNTAECDFNMGREKRNYWHRYSTYRTDSGDIDLFLIAGPKITDIIERYTDLTGKSAMLPKAALGYLGSSMYYPELEKDCDDAILEFLDTTEEEQIPMDGFQLSSGYCAVPTAEGIKRCTFTWNYTRFKDPADWFAQMNKRGIVVSPNIKPGMLLVHPLYEEMKQKNMFIKASDDNPQPDDIAIGTWWGGPGAFVDFTHPENRKLWKSYIKTALLQYGCRSIWNDNCEYDSLTDKDAKVYFEGKESTIGTVKPIMSNLMCKLSNEAILEYDPNCRPFTVCRSGHAGIQRYAQVWAGDNLTCWDSLKYNIATILGMGLCGVANHGCDIGGFYGPSPEPELFVRWVQNGIFQPRFSIHSVNTDNTVTEPWMYSDKKAYIKQAIDLRYALSPLLYSLMAKAHETGLPIMQPTFVQFQNDKNTYEEGIDFLFGDHLLVANVVEPGQTVRSVYLPQSENRNEKFYDFKTRKIYQGGQTCSIDVDLSSIPMFIRSGAIIPMSGNKLQNLTKEKTKALHILMAPDVDSQFTLYEDDGHTNNYLKGDYLKTHIHACAGEKTCIKFAHEGTYKTAVEEITLDVIHPDKAPFYVTLDGIELPHFLHRKKFEAASQGWYYSQSLKSVLVKYPNPEASHEVLISFEQFDMIGM